MDEQSFSIPIIPFLMKEPSRYSIKRREIIWFIDNVKAAKDCYS